MSNSTNYKPLLIVRSVGKNVPYISARGTPVAVSKQVMLTLYFKTGDAEPNELKCMSAPSHGYHQHLLFRWSTDHLMVSHTALWVHYNFTEK